MSNTAPHLHTLSCGLQAIRWCSEPMRFVKVEYVALASHMNGVAMVMQCCQLPSLYLMHQKALNITNICHTESSSHTRTLITHSKISNRIRRLWFWHGWGNNSSVQQSNNNNWLATVGSSWLVRLSRARSGLGQNTTHLANMFFTCAVCCVAGRGDDGSTQRVGLLSAEYKSRWTSWGNNYFK